MAPGCWIDTDTVTHGSRLSSPLVRYARMDLAWGYLLFTFGWLCGDTRAGVEPARGRCGQNSSVPIMAMTGRMEVTGNSLQGS